MLPEGGVESSLTVWRKEDAMNQIKELEHRIKVLEISLLLTNRVIHMLSFQIAMEIGSASFITKTSEMLKGLSHTHLKDPDDHKLFLQHENKLAELMGDMGKALETVLGPNRQLKQKVSEKALRKKIEEVLDSIHFEVLPVRTVIEERKREDE